MKPSISCSINVDVCPKIIVGARSSPLSRAQVVEVQKEISSYIPEVEFDCVFVETHGDKDQNTSLRTLDKTDFFTREVDEMLLTDKCRIGIHSAKDLPEPIPEGLVIAALTKGVDSADVLVLREGELLATLPFGARIATSSVRREEMVRELRDDLSFTDIRGTISQRLEKLHNREADGVVIAEAALIRLGLTHLNRVRLPGSTVPLQGQLAIVTRHDDLEMIQLFSKIDSRKKVLYLGLEVPPQFLHHFVIHCPLIQIVPRPFDEMCDTWEQFDAFTHIIFTSKSAVSIFFEYAERLQISKGEIQKKVIVVVGKRTAEKVRKHHIQAQLVALDETAEGVIALLETMDLRDAFLFWPHAARSRPILEEWMQAQKVRHQACVFYDTLSKRPEILPDIDVFDEIVFTSPSIVEAFVEFYGRLPEPSKVSCIGPITQKRLALLRCCSCSGAH